MLQEDEALALLEKLSAALDGCLVIARAQQDLADSIGRLETVAARKKDRNGKR